MNTLADIKKGDTVLLSQCIRYYDPVRFRIPMVVTGVTKTLIKVGRFTFKRDSGETKNYFRYAPSIIPFVAELDETAALEQYTAKAKRLESLSAVVTGINSKNFTQHMALSDAELEQIENAIIMLVDSGLYSK